MYKRQIFWFKVWSQLEADTGVGTFGVVAWLHVLGADLSPIPIASAVLGIAFVIALYKASDSAEKIFSTSANSPTRHRAKGTPQPGLEIYRGRRRDRPPLRRHGSTGGPGGIRTHDLRVARAVAL